MFENKKLANVDLLLKSFNLAYTFYSRLLILIDLTYFH